MRRYTTISFQLLNVLLLFHHFFVKRITQGGMGMGIRRKIGGEVDQNSAG